MRTAEQTAEPLRPRPPSNIQLEQQVLGAVFVSNDAIDRMPQLRGEHFSEELHGAIFDAATRLLGEGKPASPFTLGPMFASSGQVGTSPDVQTYIGRLAGQAASLLNVGAYADILIDLYTRRRLILAAEDMHNAAFDLTGDTSAEAIIEEHEARVAEIAPKTANERREASMAEALDATIAAANERHQRGGGLAGRSTGLKALDAKTGGLADGNLIVAAGRPGMGKSALAVNIADNVARSGAAVAFFSLEMSEIEISARILARHAGIPVEQISRGTFRGDVDMRRLLAAREQIATARLTIDTSGGLTVAQLRTRARRLHRRGMADLVIVDYLQLMQGQARHGNRVGEVTEITNGLKALAKELAVPIIALSQLNRSVEARENKRPMLSDLRESGSIEQDADIVLMCFREEYYVERDVPAVDDAAAYADWQARLDAAEGKAELIVAKARQGTTGIVRLTYNGPTTTFTDEAES